MNTEIETKKLVIVMKNGMAHWVREDTGKKAETHIVTQTAHSFIKIQELDQTINTAEISGIYTPQVYQDLKRTEAGEYKCAWGTWHTKKDTCMCASISRKRAKEKHDKIQRDRENTPLTQEEQAKSESNFKRAEEMGILNHPDSMFRSRFQKGNVGGKGIRRSIVIEWQSAHNDREPNLQGLSIDEDVL